MEQDSNYSKRKAMAIAAQKEMNEIGAGLSWATPRSCGCYSIGDLFRNGGICNVGQELFDKIVELDRVIRSGFDSPFLKTYLTKKNTNLN